VTVFEGFGGWLLGVVVAASLVSLSGYYFLFSDWRPFMQILFFIFGTCLSYWFYLAAQEIKVLK